MTDNEVLLQRAFCLVFSAFYPIGSKYLFLALSATCMINASLILLFCGWIHLSSQIKNQMTVLSCFNTRLVMMLAQEAQAQTRQVSGAV